MCKWKNKNIYKPTLVSLVFTIFAEENKYCNGEA